MIPSLPEYYVRKTTLADIKHAEQATKVFLEAYNAKDEGWTSAAKVVNFYSTTKEATEHYIRESHEGRVTQYYAFKRLENGEEEVVGSIMVDPEYKDDKGNVFPSEGYILRFAVDPKIQSKGIGGKLIKTAIDQLRQENYSGCVIWVFENRVELLNWYKKLGFVDTQEVVAWEVPKDTKLLIDVKLSVLKLKF